jgi:hypothetical protein
MGERYDRRLAGWNRKIADPAHDEGDDEPVLGFVVRFASQSGGLAPDGYARLTEPQSRGVAHRGVAQHVGACSRDLSVFTIGRMADPAPHVIRDVLDHAWESAQRLAIEVIELSRRQTRSRDAVHRQAACRGGTPSRLST